MDNTYNDKKIIPRKKVFYCPTDVCPHLYADQSLERDSHFLIANDKTLSVHIFYVYFLCFEFLFIHSFVCSENYLNALSKPLIGTQFLIFFKNPFPSIDWPTISPKRFHIRNARVWLQWCALHWNQRWPSDFSHFPIPYCNFSMPTTVFFIVYQAYMSNLIQFLNWLNKEGD